MFGQMKPPLGTLINWGHPLSRGLVAVFLMNEGSGNKITNLVINACDVTTWAGTPRWDAGSIYFDGTNDWLLLSTALRAAPFTVVSRFNVRTLATTAAYQMPWSMGEEATASYDGWYFSIAKTTGDMGFNVAQNSTYGATPTQVIVVNRWYQACGVEENSAKRHFYLDGTLVGTDTTDKTPTGTFISMFGKWLGTGATGFNIFPLNGVLGFTYLYNRALSPQEVWQLYQSPYAMFERRPVWMDYVAAAGGLSIPVAMHHYKMMRNN